VTTAAYGNLTCSCTTDTPCADAQKSIALPDMHSGYGFAIGNVAAFDMADPLAVVSPGGVGFDINCGVRLIRTNLVRRAVPRPAALPGCGPARACLGSPFTHDSSAGLVPWGGIGLDSLSWS